jgi:Uma2 family endonuclease
MAVSSVEEKLVLGPGIAGTYMTPDEFDFVQDCDELYVYELINGVLIVNPPPSIGERGPNEILGHWLWNYRDQHPQGNALNYTVTEQTISTGNNRRRVDRAIWAGIDHMPDLERDVPTIAIEFVSKGRRNRHRDYEIKRQEYQQAGVSEYWIIDRFDRKMTVVCLGADGATETTVREAECYSTPLLPGFELSVSRLLAEADRVRPTSEQK